MNRLVWSTDLHLNFVDLGHWEAWLTEIQNCNGDALVVTGDISEAEDLQWQLDRMGTSLGIPLYFVLGNHDFYGSSIERVRAQTAAFCRTRSDVHFLTASEPVPLNSNWVLVGHDGWADARLGNYTDSPVRMADFERIENLVGLNKLQRGRLLEELGWTAASELRASLNKAVELARCILIATHIPPFREACWYQGRVTDDHWAPFFTCDAIGRTLRDFAETHRHHLFHVLCGHTHHSGQATIVDNLRVWTGEAHYGAPAVDAILDLNRIAEPFLATHIC